MYLWSIGLSIAVYCAIKSIRWSVNRWKFLQTFRNASIAGPPPEFWRGNFRLSDKQYIFKSLDQWLQEYGDTFGYYRGDRAILVTANPELIKQIFIQRGHQFPNRFRMMIELQPFSSSILGLRDDRWRQNRRILTPAFNRLKLESSKLFRQILDESLQRLMTILTNDESSANVDYCHHQINGNSLVNISQLSKRYTLDIISRYSFSIDDQNFYGQSPLFDNVEEFFRENCDTTLVRTAMVVPFLKQIIKFINDNITSARLINDLTRYLRQKIIDYRMNLSNNNDIGNSEKNLLDSILAHLAQNNLTDNEVIGNILVILMAGYETTACGISFILFNLAKHPEIQEALRNELMNVSDDHHDGNGHGTPSIELLDQIIFESLRLYPPVVDYLIREFTDKINDGHFEFELNGVRKTLPNHVAIQVPVWQIHHDHHQWSPNPYEFDPYRFDLPRLSSTRATLSMNDVKYLTFGLGQRHCIGASIALMEIRSIVSGLVRNFRIKLSASHRYQYDHHGLLKIRSHAELIVPVEDIWLEMEKI